MKIWYDTGLKSFQPWSGAVYWYDALKRMDALLLIEDDLAELFPDGMSEAELNDFLWFDVNDYMQENYSMPEGWEFYSDIDEAQETRLLVDSFESLNNTQREAEVKTYSNKELVNVINAYPNWEINLCSELMKRAFPSWKLDMGYTIHDLTIAASNLGQKLK